MKNPHLSPDGHDYDTQNRHCMTCEDIVLQGDGSMFQSYVMVKYHKTFPQDLPGVLAKDEQGKTIENVYARPSRTVMVHEVIIHLHCAECWSGPNPLDSTSGTCEFCHEPVTEPAGVKLEVFTVKDDNTKRLTFFSAHLDCIAD